LFFACAKVRIQVEGSKLKVWSLRSLKIVEGLKVQDSKFIYCIIKDEKWYVDEEAPPILPPKGGERNVVYYAIGNLFKNKNDLEIYCIIKAE
jgi:hypothetical protein